MSSLEVKCPLDDFTPASPFGFVPLIPVVRLLGDYDSWVVFTRGRWQKQFLLDFKRKSREGLDMVYLSPVGNG